MNRWLLAILPALLLLCAAAPAQTAADYNAAGAEHYKAKEWDHAIEAFSSAYELMPGNDTVRHNLCNAYQAMANDLAHVADYATAASYLETAITVHPENPSPLIQLGSYYLRFDKTRDAMFRLEEAIELDPSNVTAHELLGDAYYKENDLPSALAQWDWVLEQEPNRTNVREKIEKAQREESVERNFSARGKRSRHFTVTYEPETAQTVNKALVQLERAYVSIGSKLGGVYPDGPIQVIAYTAQSFAEATLLGDHVGAVYDGKIRVPLKDKTGKAIADKDLERRLYHEYTHVVVRCLVGDNAPFWFNEGLAETFSNDLLEERQTVLKAAYDKDALFPLASLESGQLDTLNADTLHLAYCQSHATVKHLWVRFGPARMIDMISDLAAGLPPEDSLRRNYNRTYALLEREVAGNIKQGKF